MTKGLEQLWAGWRSEYVVAATDAERHDAEPGGECIFCRIVRSGPPSLENGVVWRGDQSLVVLNLYPYASGHLLVVPLRHAEALGELTYEESADMWSAARTAVAAITDAFHPDGINLGANLGRAAGAGIPRHLHLHVVPRWSGDTNFMTSVAGVRVLPQPLSETWEKLQAVWPVPLGS